MQSVFAVCWLSGDGPSTCSKLCFQVEAVQSMSYNWSLGHFWLCSCWFVTLERNKVITVTVQAVTVCAFHAVFFFQSLLRPHGRRGEVGRQTALLLLHNSRIVHCPHYLKLCINLSVNLALPSFLIRKNELCPKVRISRI